VARLVQLLNTNDTDLRQNSLWAVKNLVRKAKKETKEEVMSQLGWLDIARQATHFRPSAFSDSLQVVS
jgi:hypothetical protein